MEQERRLSPASPRTLYTIAYPTLSASDTTFIEEFRRHHDAERQKMIAPHFTLVFACRSLPQSAYLAHIESVARQAAPLRWHSRYAMLGTDERNTAAHVFLVPEEGFAALSMLHDRLYEGPLRERQQLDIPYIPHITIGTLADRMRARQLCEALNAKGLSIEGSVDALTVGALQNGRFEQLAVFPLGAQTSSLEESP